MASCIASYMYDEVAKYNQLLATFKVSKLGQILCVDKTVFLWPSHICENHLYKQS